MSETEPDPARREPTSARWVKARVVGEEPAPPPAEAPPPDAGESGPIPVPDQPPVTEEELAGARWFAIAFLVLVVPLGLVLLAMLVWWAIQWVRWW